MPNEEGTAQPAAEGSVTPSGTSDSGGEASSGVQKRIDELTAKNKEAERQLAEANLRTQQLLELQAMQATQYAPPAPAEPPKPKINLPEGIDPQFASFFEASMNLAVAQAVEATEKRLAPQLRGTAMTVAQMEIERAAGDLDPEVKARAHQLYANWQRSGKTGFEPIDAVRYAVGEFATDPRRRTQARDDLGRFNKGTGGMLGSGAQPPIAPPSEPPVPAFAQQDNEAFDPAASAAFWKNRLIERSKKEQSGQ